MRELAGSVCPECGGDRGVVGVIEPLPAVMSARWLAVLAWWFAVAALAWLANPLVRELMPHQLSYHEDYQLTPRSGLYGPFVARRIGHGEGWKGAGPWPEAPRRAGVSGNAAAAFNNRFITVMDVDPRRGFGSYGITRYEGGSAKQTPLGPRSGAFDAAFVLGWLQQMEIDTARADVRAEAEELAGLLVAPKFEPVVYEGLKHFAVTVTPVKSAGPPVAWAATAAMVLWAGVAAVGTALILWRWRRSCDVATQAAGPVSAA